jgi:hypothetical protein
MGWVTDELQGGRSFGPTERVEGQEAGNRSCRPEKVIFEEQILFLFMGGKLNYERRMKSNFQGYNFDKDLLKKEATCLP